MTHISASDFRKNLFGHLDEAIKLNVPVSVSTKSGNAVVISESEYRGMLETIYVNSVPGLKQSILDGIASGKNERIAMRGRNLEQFIQEEFTEE